METRRPGPPPATLAWAARAVGRDARVVWTRAIPAGSCALLALSVADGAGRVHRLVLRRFDDRERPETDPWYLPEREAAVLGRLESGPVPAPVLVAEDVRAVTCDTLLTDRFLEAYQHLSGRSDDRHPYWDLLDAVDSLPDMVEPHDQAGAELFDRFERWVGAVAAELLA